MKLKSSFGMMLKSVALMVALVALMMGCEKEHVTPINPGDTTDTTDVTDTTGTVDTIPVVPTGENFCLYGRDTLQIKYVMLLYMETFYETVFELSNGAMVEVVSNTPPMNGTQGFTTLLGVFDGSSDCCAFYTDGDFDDIFQKGSLTIQVSGDNYQYRLNAISTNGVSVQLFYGGPIADLTDAAGDGEITFGGHTYSFDRGSCTPSGSLYHYDLSDGDRKIVVGIYTPTMMANGTSFAITDQDIVASTASLYFELDGGYGYADGIGMSGTVESAVSGDTYVVTFSGESDRGPFSGRYAGSITQLTQKAKVAKLNQRIFAKARR